MSEQYLQTSNAPASPSPAAMSQFGRVVSAFTAPTRVFTEIGNGRRSWWLPLILMIVSFGVYYGIVTEHVTWSTVFENQERNLPEFAKNMMNQMTPEQKAARQQRGPVSTAITSAVAPFGVLLLDVIGAGILLATINFGFGGKATFGAIFAVELYAGLAIWPIRWLLGAITTLFTDPETFNYQNPSPTNIAAFLPMQETPKALYYFLMSLDGTVIWGMILTSIGLAIVARVSRTSGYIAVFGWWLLGVLLSVGVGAAFS